MKKVWLWNHYATNMFFDRGGRHYYFAKYLLKNGYTPTIFCANTFHNSDKIVEVGNGIYRKDATDGIDFIFVKTTPYSGNGFSRIRNMLVFAQNVLRVAKTLAVEVKPDVILASSVHPFTCVAGIWAAKKLGIPCIVEIRDLWPESIVEYKGISKNNPIIRMLYHLEKWIYNKADKIIFTMEGGADYIREKGWEQAVDMDKIFHINNGVDLEEFDNNANSFTVEDLELTDKTALKIIYTGSVRFANNLKPVVDAASIVMEMSKKKIYFLIYGTGDHLESLKNYVKSNEIVNVFFKGRVEKKYIPYVLKNADISLIHGEVTSISRFGFSLNKQFDYFAAGRPILSDLACNYNLIKKYDCGVVIEEQSSETIAGGVLNMASLAEENYCQYSENARRAASDYDYRVLTDKLIRILVCTIK